MILAYLVGYYGVAVVCLFFLWLLFIIAMAFKLANDDDRLAPCIETFGRRFVVFGTIYDVLCNIFFATGVFFEIPREFTVSARLQRLVDNPTWKWQRPLAIWFAVTLMNPFCKKDQPHIRVPE